MRCGHQVPCTCSEYLNRLNVEQLENLRTEFGRVVVNDNLAVSTGNAILCKRL